MAIEAIGRESREAYQLAAFPIWLEHGKKGQTFNKFLRKLNLSDKQKIKQSKRMTPEQLSKLYAQAESIKKRVKHGTV